MVRNWVFVSLCLVLVVASGCGDRQKGAGKQVDVSEPTIDTAAVAEYVTIDSKSVEDKEGVGMLTMNLTVSDLPEGKTLVVKWMEVPGQAMMVQPVVPDESGKATMKVFMTARNANSSVVLALQ